MTKRDALREFKLDAMYSGGFTDYWSMQLEWATFVDYLEREGRITARQRDTWNNPTTPENFRRWNRLNFGCYPDKN